MVLDWSYIGMNDVLMMSLTPLVTNYALDLHGFRLSFLANGPRFKTLHKYAKLLFLYFCGL